MDLKRLDWILFKAQDIDLNSWEDRFIDDMTERREKYGDDIDVTFLQEDKLEHIAAK